MLLVFACVVIMIASNVVIVTMELQPWMVSTACLAYVTGLFVIATKEPPPVAKEISLPLKELRFLNVPISITH